jgi:hypothetical protein
LVPKGNLFVIILSDILHEIIDLGRIGMLFLRNRLDVLDVLNLVFVAKCLYVFFHLWHAQDLVDGRSQTGLFLEQDID